MEICRWQVQMQYSPRCVSHWMKSIQRGYISLTVCTPRTHTPAQSSQIHTQKPAYNLQVHHKMQRTNGPLLCTIVQLKWGESIVRNADKHCMCTLRVCVHNGAAPSPSSVIAGCTQTISFFYKSLTNEKTLSSRWLYIIDVYMFIWQPLYCFLWSF